MLLTHISRHPAVDQRLHVAVPLTGSAAAMALLIRLQIAAV